MFNKVQILVIALLISACQLPTKYQDAEKPSNKFGFEETLIAPDTFRVSFEGNYETKKDTVENYMLYRAAELAKKSGHEYILFLDKEVEKDQKILDVVQQYNYRNAFGGPGNTAYSYPYYSYGITPSAMATRDRVKEKYEAISYVQFFEGYEYSPGMIRVKDVLREIKVRE